MLMFIGSLKIKFNTENKKIVQPMPSRILP